MQCAQGRASAVSDYRRLWPVSDTNTFGPIVDPDAVEQAVQAVLADYLPFYLGELERIKGYETDAIARPAGIITASEFAKWPEDQLPLVMVVSPGLEGKPTKTPAGAYEAAWSITVAAIVADVDELSTRRLMGAYAAAIRACIVQHKGLRSTANPDGFAQFTAWLGESYSDIPFVDSRALDSCRVVFSVGVQDVVKVAAGPRTIPATSPGTDPGPYPQVSGVDIDVELEPLTA